MALSSPPVQIVSTLLVFSMVLAACGSSGGTAQNTEPPPSMAASTTATLAASTTTGEPVTTTNTLSTSTSVVGTLPAIGGRVTFQAGDFTLVGDLQAPDVAGPYPVVIMVHGGGGSDRTDWGRYPPLMERFMAAGYAVFSWDKPGVGESVGELSTDADVIPERAAILEAAIDHVTTQPGIDADRVGLWGISQAAYVMTWALQDTDAIAFMIMVGGPAMDSYDQGAYLVGQRAVCAGATVSEARAIEETISALDKALTYEEYAAAAEALVGDPYLTAMGLSLVTVPEDDWEPEDRTRPGFFNPASVLAHTTIPVLAIFGELDRQVDPVQGAAEIGSALEAAGNTHYRVEVIPNVDHDIVHSATGCLSEQATYTPTERLGYPAEYLDLLEDWLTARA